MTLDEAIKHAEEVADGHDIIKQIKAVTLEECKHAEEYRQLAEWLKDYKRMLNQELAKKSIEASEQPYDEFGFFDPFNVKDKEIEDAISRRTLHEAMDEYRCCESFYNSRNDKIDKQMPDDILNKWIGAEVLDRIRNELHATAEKHEDGVYYLRDEWVDDIFDKYKDGK